MPEGTGASRDLGKPPASLPAPAWRTRTGIALRARAERKKKEAGGLLKSGGCRRTMALQLWRGSGVSRMWRG